jgi:indole-3-glycerol phosphate synthase
VAVPLLAKDFFVDPWQVIEARAHGADAILVIMGLVDDSLAQALARQAEDLGMDVVCEAHSEPQVARAMRLGFPIIGINARDMDTLEVDPARQLRLISAVPPGFLIIGESGIGSVSDARRVAAAGAGAVLVGTALMRNPDLLSELVGL